MGLLDDFSSFIKTPEGMGLLSAVAGGLAGAQRGAPLNSLGRAGLAGVMGYGNALDRQERTLENEQQRKLRQMQMGDIERKTGAISAYRNTLPPTEQAMFDVDPVGYVTAARKTEEGYTLTPGAKRFKGSNVIAEVPIERKAPEGMQYDAQGNLVAIPGYVQMKSQIAAAGRQPAQPFFQFLPTAEGYAVGNARSGTISPVMINGKPVIKASDSPALQAEISGAKEGAKTIAEETTKAAIDAPRVIDNATTALKYSDELLKHPGFGQAVGKSSMLGLQKIPGTEGRDFMNRLDQLKGGAFLEAFNTLKGGGQITEIEGKKATDAIARMDNSTSEEEFKAAVKDYQDVIRKGMNRAKMKAKPIAPVQSNQGGVKFLGFE